MESKKFNKNSNYTNSEQNLITEHIRIDFGAVLKGVMGSFKSIIGSSLAKGMGIKIALAKVTIVNVK